MDLGKAYNTVDNIFSAAKESRIIDLLLTICDSSSRGELQHLALCGSNALHLII